MPAKLSDIARLAGVSKSTASRALQGSKLVNEKTRRLVLEKAKELKYVPNSLAQAMATKRSRILGYLMFKKDPPYVSHTFFGPVLDGAIKEADRQGYHIMLAAAKEIDDTFDEHFIQDCIDGAMLVSYYPEEVIREFRRRGIPLVIINTSVDSENNAFIVDDNYSGACAVMEHLIKDRGHRKILLINESQEHPSFHDRYRGYLDSLKKYGIPEFRKPCQVSTTSFQEGVAAMTRVLAGGGNLPTAIFAVTDTLALGAIEAIRKAGLRVPEDIAVAGYDDIEFASMWNPALTSISVDREQIGRAAVTALIEQIADPMKPSRTITIKNRLIIREST